MRDELEEYIDVLMGRRRCPIDRGELTMMEYANVVYSRGKELEYLILQSEATGHVSKGSPFYRFRTGELRAFTELAARAVDLGSRRVTVAQMEYDEKYG